MADRITYRCRCAECLELDRLFADAGFQLALQLPAPASRKRPKPHHSRGWVG